MTLQQAAGYQNQKDFPPQQAAGNYQVKNERTATPTRYRKSRKRKRGCGMTRNPLIFMVGGTGIEPVTSTV